MKSVYRAVRTGSLNKAVCVSSLKGLSSSSIIVKDEMQNRSLMATMNVTANSGNAFLPKFLNNFREDWVSFFLQI